MEDLFRMLPPLKSSNFVGLKEELEATGDVTSSPAPSNIHHFCLQALWTQCSAGQNDALTEKLAEVFRIFWNGDKSKCTKSTESEYVCIIESSIRVIKPCFLRWWFLGVSWLQVMTQKTGMFSNRPPGHCTGCPSGGGLHWNRAKPRRSAGCDGIGDPLEESSQSPGWRRRDGWLRFWKPWNSSKGQVIPCYNPSCPPTPPYISHIKFSKIHFPTFQTIIFRIIYPKNYFNCSPQDYPNVSLLKYVLTTYISWLYIHKLHNQLRLSCKFFCTPCSSLKFLVYVLHNILPILLLLCQDFLLSIAYLSLNKRCKLYFYQ